MPSPVTPQDKFTYIMYVDESLPIVRLFKYEQNAQKIAEHYKSLGFTAYVWKREIE